MTTTTTWTAYMLFSNIAYRFIRFLLYHVVYVPLYTNTVCGKIIGLADLTFPICAAHWLWVCFFFHFYYFQVARHQFSNDPAIRRMWENDRRMTLDKQGGAYRAKWYDQIFTEFYDCAVHKVFLSIFVISFFVVGFSISGINWIPICRMYVCWLLIFVPLKLNRNDYFKQNYRKY